MPKRKQTPDRPTDVNQLARRIVAISTGEEEDTAPEVVDPKAVKRGEARAAKMTPKQRLDIAKKAADKRWHGTG